MTIYAVLFNIKTITKGDKSVHSGCYENVFTDKKSATNKMYELSDYYMNRYIDYFDNEETFYRDINENEDLCMVHMESSVNNDIIDCVFSVKEV